MFLPLYFTVRLSFLKGNLRRNLCFLQTAPTRKCNFTSQKTGAASIGLLVYNIFSFCVHKSHNNRNKMSFYVNAVVWL